MSLARLALVLLLFAGPAVAETAQPRAPRPPTAQTVVAPRTTVTVEENATVSQPGSSVRSGHTPTQPNARRRARPRPAAGANNGYSSYLTGPIDLRRPPPAR